MCVSAADGNIRAKPSYYAESARVSVLPDFSLAEFRLGEMRRCQLFRRFLIQLLERKGREVGVATKLLARVFQTQRKTNTAK